MRRCGGCFPLVLRLLVVTAAIGGLVAPAAVAKSFPPNWPQSPGVHPVGKRLARSAIPAPVFAANLRGGYAIAGNTLLTCPENPSSTRRRAGARAADAAACLNANNNDKDMKYVNVDPGGTPNRFDSSTATLSVPTGARVVRAFLYWGADLARGVQSTEADKDGAPGGEHPDTNALWRTALLKTGTGAYTTIDAQQQGRDGQWDGVASWYEQPGLRPGYAYQVRADVTTEISNALASPAAHASGGTTTVNATVANVQAGKGNNRHGAWTLVVVWENDTAAWRNLTLFDGFAFVQVSGGQQLVVGPLQFSGFKTPSSGPVDAHVATWTYEGDRGIVDDYMALGDLTNTCSSLTYHVFDAVNPVSNFFNSTISRGGANVTSKVPNFNNQLGYDLDQPSIPEGTIKNAATGAAVCLGTTGDTYFFGGLAFDTLIRAPNLGITKTADKHDVNPGDTVTYTVTVSNPQRPEGQTPTDPATNVVTSEPIPSGLEFVRFTANPPLPPPLPQLPIPACAYNVGAIRIDCKAGTLPPGGTFTYSYEARVTGAAQGSAPATITNTACFRANSEDQPGSNFVGCNFAAVVVPPAPIPIADLGVTKTVSATTVKPGDNLVWTLDARNYGPDASTNFTVSDVLPSNVGFVSLATSPAGLTCTTPPAGSNGTITCTAAPSSVPKDGAFKLTIVGQVAADTADGTVLNNVATVSGTEAEPAPDPHPNRDNVLSRVIVPDEPLPPEIPPPLPPPDPDGNLIPEAPVAPPEPPPPPAGTTIALTKVAHPTHVPAGGNVTFTLTVKNTGDASALGVKVCDDLPGSMSVVSAPGFSSKGGQLCRSVGTLLHSASKSFKITVRVSPGAPTKIVNTATATASNAKSASAKAAVRVEPTDTSAGEPAGVTG